MSENNIESIDPSVRGFYAKNPEENYKDEYDKQHLPRLIATMTRFQLGSLHGQKIGDFAGGRGKLLSLLPQDNEFVIYDGADLTQQDLYCQKAVYNQVDLERNLKLDRTLDVAFCFEVCEHVGNLFRLLSNIKDATKINSNIYISIPDERMLHNTIYYDVIFPHTNFIGFLEDMALPVIDHYFWDSGWPSHLLKCRNLEWRNRRMRFWKNEQKFRDADLVQTTNL